jgi:hypothetical protein
LKANDIIENPSLKKELKAQLIALITKLQLTNKIVSYTSLYKHRVTKECLCKLVLLLGRRKLVLLLAAEAAASG